MSPLFFCSKLRRRDVRAGIESCSRSFLSPDPNLIRDLSHGSDGTESEMIISCIPAFWVVMHYYEQGIFPNAKSAMVRRKSRALVGTSLMHRTGNCDEPGLAWCRRLRCNRKRNKKIHVPADRKSASGGTKKKLSRRESANLKGDLGKFEETAASPSHAGYGSLPEVI